MTLIAISVLLSPLFINQLASSQSQVPPNGQQQQEGEEDGQGATTNNLSARVSNVGRLGEEEEDDNGAIANGLQQASNLSSHFIFPSQEQFFFPSVNATRQTDVAILNGTWAVETSRAIIHLNQIYDCAHLTIS